MPKTLPRSTHFLFCLLSAAWHTREATLTLHGAQCCDWQALSSWVYFAPTVGNLWRKQWTEHQMASAQGWADCSHNESEANAQKMMKPVPVTAREETELTSRGDSAWRASKTQLWDCTVLSGTILLWDELLTELLVLTGYSLCSALGWSDAEKTKVLYHPRQSIQKGHRIS